MQTFLPYPDFRRSLECLDFRRLGKQRVETFQILDTIIYRKKSWSNHPAVNIWRGYEPALALYGDTSIDVFIERGGRNGMLRIGDIGRVEMPWWFGDEAFHSSHRSNLLRKDPVFYGKFGWTDDPAAPYIWPRR